jgi:hypothetical protein
MAIEALARPFVSGEGVREWEISVGDSVIYPYVEIGGAAVDSLPVSIHHRLWPNRSLLSKRSVFKRNMTQMGKHWYELLEHYVAKLRSPASLAVGEIATHNHFVLDRGGKVFNQTAPVLKLAFGATEDDHLELLGLLNSSTACFWLKQICFPKGGDHVGTEGARVTKNQWEERYAFDSTKLKQFPIPKENPLAITKLIQAEADARSALLPEKVCAAQVPAYELLSKARDKAGLHISRMIALQEELDWQCYRLYGIVDEELTLPPDQIPHLKLGERAFEIVLARADEEPLWFERHHSTPITKVPSDWPEAYRKLVERRIALIDSNRDIALIERPEYKRRWNLPSWQEMESAELKRWLLDRIEANLIWQEHRLVSCAQLRDVLSRDADWISVADLYNGNPIENLEGFVARLAVPEAVPFLPALRYTESGLRKRAEWEEVWRLQREEDAGQQINIPVPPKYVTKDFQKGDYWRLRGGLDVPKERFILYPGLERDSDQTPVLGWAGWNHLEQARALATYYQRMRTEEGWEPDRLKPILAGVLDLKPWLIQWHNELDHETGERLGQYFAQFAESQCQELGFSPEEVRAWQPNSTAGPGRRARRRTQ